LENDLTHPNTNGVTKVANQLLAFFKTDPTTAPWFLKPTTTPPSVTASANPSVGVAPLTVNLSADSSAGRFYWTFDDGDSSLEQNPTKIFPAPGRYDVCLAALDAAGNTALTTLVVNVSGPFVVSSASIESNDVRIVWTATGGLKYAVEASSNLTNYFSISPVISVPGPGAIATNYVDAGGTTNTPARFYRVKLVP
jgi:PKD repeat protein